MQHDELENFIQNNREAFDDQMPPVGLWEEVTKVSKPKSVNKFTVKRFFRIAATIAVLLACTLTFGNDIIFSQFEQSAINRRLPADFTEIEQFYSRQSLDIYEHLVDFGAEDVVKDDLKEIDQTVSKLKKELVATVPGTESEIVDNIIKSYQMKLQILQRVFERIQNQEPHLINVVNDETTL